MHLYIVYSFFISDYMRIICLEIDSEYIVQNGLYSKNVETSLKIGKKKMKTLNIWKKNRVQKEGNSEEIEELKN